MDMAYLTAAPELVAAAATDLANIGSTIDLANEAAALPTTGVLAAGADEVSAGIASLFGAHAQAYQALSTQAARFHAQFVQLAGGFRQRCYSYEIVLDWDGETRRVEVLTLDGNPLLGNGFWQGSLLQAENQDGGEVLFESL